MSPLLPLMLLCILVTLASAEAAGRRFAWIVEYDFTLPADQKELSITINGQTPGPTLLAHQGDALIIQVTNRLGQNLAIEWNGVRQIEEAVTQDSIPPGKTVTFRFSVDQLGTYPYYARSRMQRQAGLYGWIRVSPPNVGESEPFKEGADKAAKLPPLVMGSGQTKGSKSP